MRTLIMFFLGFLIVFSIINFIMWYNRKRKESIGSLQIQRHDNLQAGESVIIDDEYLNFR